MVKLLLNAELLEEDKDGATQEETNEEIVSEEISEGSVVEEVSEDITDEVVAVAAVANEVVTNEEPQQGGYKGKARKWDNRRGDKKERRPRRQVEWKKEYEEKMLEVRRVTRVTTGGRQLAFRATMLIGNKNGKVGLWIAKANDVQWAVSKATHDAYKNIVDVTITSEGTVPYPISKKWKASQIKLVPAKPGTGLKAGSSVRSVLELAWFTNMLSKIVGTNNVLNNAMLTIDMISKFKNFSLRFKERIKVVDNAENIEENSIVTTE